MARWAKVKVRKGIYYFPHYTAARHFAEMFGFPTHRIISYQIGWAIQFEKSGDYVGPNSISKVTGMRASAGVGK